ncbi:MAG TPA: DUF6263 family protein [Vicinamibacterales bacterium]|nr:DUF6263 family protein [Vicinamibacterales bacterium]
MKRCPAVATLVLLCLSAAAADAQTVTLRYRWTKGESRTYRVTTQTDNAITGMPGGRVTTSQTMTQVLQYAAEEVAPDGSATVRQTFQSIRMETVNPNGKFVIDSGVRETSQNRMVEGMRAVLAAMAGESVVIELAPDGAVRRVEGASRIADKVSKVMAADPAAAQAGQGIRTSLSDEALKTTLEQTFPRLSGPPVKVGDQWQGALAMGNPAIGRITGRSTFTLKAIDGAADAAVARIAVALVLRQDVVPPPSGPAGMVMTLGDAKGAGEIVFDVAKGFIQKSTMKTDLPSTVVMTGQDGAPATMENKAATTMTMELVVEK